MTTIHHINCGTLCPAGGRLISGEGGLTGAKMICHCLLIEAGDELILVDTGFGADDARHPYKRLGIPFNVGIRPKPELADTAIERVKAMGHDPADVRRIACTHLDLDHAGGLPDFPDADVHVFAPERRAAVDPKLLDRPRYPACHISHGPKWVSHETGGDTWMGFESVRIMEGADVEIALIPLLGHSRGHSAIAVRDGDGWLMHCGDAYFHHGQVEQPPHCPPALLAFQKLMAEDGSARVRNLARLQELARDHGDEVRLFCAHDPVELEREAAA